MPSLHWIGKDKVVAHHQDVPVHELVAQYGFTVDGRQEEATDTGNMVIHGDNLVVLKSLLPKFEGKVDFIYIDPPYNTGKKDEWVYNDDVSDPRILAWLGRAVGKEGEDLTRHDKWLCMMYPRLQLLRRLMSQDGFIFISIDDNEAASLRIICDEIFGVNNFVGQWTWFKSATPPNLSHKIKRNVEYILCYQRAKNGIRFHGIKKVSKSNDPIIKPQNTFKELSFKAGEINVSLPDGVIPAGTYGTEQYPNELLNDMVVEDGVNANVVTFRNRFIWVQSKLEEEIKNGTLIFCSNKLVLAYKKAEYDAETPPNLIDESVGVTTTENAGVQQENIFGKKVFEFPKPSSLIEYLAGFKENSIILDCFGGSGTTAEAVLQLNARDGGNRKFILVELNDYAETITAERIKRVIQGYTTKKKTTTPLYRKKLTLRNLKRADVFLEEARKIAEQEAPKYSRIVGPKLSNSTIELFGETAATATMPGLGGSFNFFEIGEPIFKDDMLNPDVSEDSLREYVYYTETRRSLTRKRTVQEPYLLNIFNDTAYYFYHDPGHETILSEATLANLVTEAGKAEKYIIYADACLISAEKLRRRGITFKKISREIHRF